MRKRTTSRAKETIKEATTKAAEAVKETVEPEYRLKNEKGVQRSVSFKSFFYVCEDV